MAVAALIIFAIATGAAFVLAGPFAFAVAVAAMLALAALVLRLGAHRSSN